MYYLSHHIWEYIATITLFFMIMITLGNVVFIAGKIQCVFPTMIWHGRILGDMNLCRGKKCELIRHLGGGDW